MNPSRTEAVKKFLEGKAQSDLAKLYNIEMEMQCNVAQDGGNRVDGEFKGRQWHGWTDGTQLWKSFRVPLGANTDNAHYEDRTLTFNLEEHVEGIGLTGWNWKLRKSVYCAYDFDSILSHSSKSLKNLTNEELENIIKIVSEIPWITVRKSASGKGLHLYIFIDPNFKTVVNNHNEHAALARSILGKLSAETGFDFSTKVDTCGSNIWVWHRKSVNNPESFKLIKQGTYLPLDAIPKNWKEHLNVITNRRKKTLPQFIDENKVDYGSFEELCGQRAKIQLDEDHKKLIKFLSDSIGQKCWWWDNDHYMLVTHTIHLAEAHQELGLKGIFKTISKGKEYGHDHNIFCFPLRHGSWSVRRFSPGCAEAETWFQDGSGYTTCYLNKNPDLPIAAKSFGGVEHEKGGFVFREAEIAAKAAHYLGVDVQLPPWASGREAKLKPHKDGRLIFEVEHKANDPGVDGWLPEKGKLKRIFSTSILDPIEPEVGNYDKVLRHLITETGDDYGWMLNSEGRWVDEPLIHAKHALKSIGLKQTEIDVVIGGSVTKPWLIVNKPFQDEFPGDREWNKNSPQLRFLPKEDKENLNYSTWQKLLNHLGHSLNDAVQENGWCKVNGIATGSDYLKCWISSLFQFPLQPLPYLFFYGPQNSGKSSFHEALSLLVTKGCVRADNALLSQSGFNGELENAILCIIEETNLNSKGPAYNRVKDFVTSRYIPIRQLYKQTYSIPNTTHWCQMSNEYTSCPVFAGDTRVVMIFVDNLDPLDLIPKKKFIDLLEKEARDFITEILALEIPDSNDRLNVPVITTQDKLDTEEMNLTDLQRFIKEHCHYVSGKMIKFSEFMIKFHEDLEPEKLGYWSKIKTGRELPPQYPKGRWMQDGAQYYIGNISWSSFKPSDPVLPKIYASNGVLITSKEPKINGSGGSK